MAKIVDLEPADSSSARKVHPALGAYLGYCLYKAALRHRADLNDALTQYSLISSHLGIFCLLNSDGPKSQMELGDLLGIDKATMVKLLDGLEAQKAIQRDACTKDRRVKNVSITKSGEKLLQKLMKVRTSVEKKFLSVLTATEIDQLRKILPKLIFNADSLGVATPPAPRSAS